jgi:hypothetical protein
MIDTGYELPWQISVTRAAGSTNQVASYQAPVTPGSQYTVSLWMLLAGIAATPYVRIGWFAQSGDPVTSAIATLDLPNLPNTQNVYVRYKYQVTVPNNANYARVMVRDHSTDPAGTYSFTGVQFEIGDHDTTFADAASQPNCHPADGSSNYVFCYSRRDAGMIARIGGRGAVDKFSGSVVASSFRTAATGRRLLIETLRGSNAAIGRIQWYDEGQADPSVLGVDRSGSDTVQGDIITQMYALTPPESLGGRYGKWSIGPVQCLFGMEDRAGSTYVPGMLVVRVGASGGSGGGAQLYGNGGMSAASFNVVSTAESKGTPRHLKKGHGYLDRVRKLRPATYRLKTDPEGPLRLGIIAEEAHEVAP